MTVTRNTGADLLPFGPRQRRPEERDDIVTIPRPSPWELEKARKLLKARENAQARQAHGAPPPDAAFNAERLRRDLASLPLNVLLNDRASGSKAATRQELRRRGWTDERLRRAMVALRDDLQGRVHPPAAATVTAGAASPRRGSLSAPPAVASFERLGTVAQHVAAARAAGYDPVMLWPSLRGLLASGGPDRPFPVAGPPAGRPSRPNLGASTSGPNRRAPGGRGRRTR
jgi:hypothetical protein